MTAQRSNCNLFVLFGVSVVHYILRVVPQDDAIPPWLNSGKVTDDETRPLPLFHSNDFLEPSDEGSFYYVMGW